MARRRKVAGKRFTIEQIVCALWTSHGIVTKAAKLLGIDVTTLTENYILKYPEIEEAKEAIKEANKDEAEYNILESIHTEGDLMNSRWYLERKAKERGYIKRDELTGRDGIPIQVAPPTNYQENIESEVRQLTQKERDDYREFIKSRNG